MFDFKNFLNKGRSVKNIALLVDGPNMIRSQFNVDLQEVVKELEEFGRVRVAKVFLNQYASDKLIEAITNIGFEAVITPTDADVPMAIAGVDLIYNKNIDVIALMTRDSDLMHVFIKAKEHGKETILVAVEDQLSIALKNVSDKVVLAKVHASKRFDLDKKKVYGRESDAK